MPTYTYKCRACDYMFDQRQSMSDDPLTVCPNCDEPQLRKVINSAGIVFKGSGFYVTDNRNGSTSKSSSAGTSTTTTETGSSSSETKSSSSDNTKVKDSSSSTPKKAEKAAASTK